MRVNSLCGRACMAVLGVVLWLGCEKAPELEKASPRPVVVLELRRSDPWEALRLTGTVEPWAEEDVAFEVSGRLEYVVEPGTILEGRWVARRETDVEPPPPDTTLLEGRTGDGLVHGDVLGRLDRTPYEVALSSAKASVELARVNMEKIAPAQAAAAKARLFQAEEELKRAESIRKESPQAFSEKELIAARSTRDAALAAAEQATASVIAAQAELRQAEAQRKQAELDLKHATLLAPFTGEVTDVSVQAGGYVSAGDAVAHLVMMDPIKVRVTVSSESARRIIRGDPVQVFVPDAEQTLKGTVYHKSSVANASTRTFSVTVICRNWRALSTPVDDPSATELPRVQDILPATRLPVNQPGPLYVDELRVLQQDEEGFFVWTAEGVNIESDTPLYGAFTARKVRVVPGERRVNFQGIFLARQLADSGGLQPGQACLAGVSPGITDGDRVALLRETWILQPGSLVELQFARDTGVSGYYVPVQSLVTTGANRGHLFLVQGQGGANDGPEQAERIDVTLHEEVGQLQRIEPVDPDAIAEGARVILQGAEYVKSGELVSVVRTQNGIQ